MELEIVFHNKSREMNIYPKIEEKIKFMDLFIGKAFN